jgi:hypothetical protein
VELAARRRTTRIFAVTPVNMDDVLYSEPPYDEAKLKALKERLAKLG